MRTRVCHGGIIAGITTVIILTVTSFTVLYKSLAGDTSSSYRSDRPGAPVKPRTQQNPNRRPVAALEGYARVIDQKPLKMHCNSCALVTSSGQLTGSERGKEIDGTECVIRMNDAPSAGYQRDVGRRTSLRVVAHSSLQRVLRSRQELLNTSQDSVFLVWGPSSSMRRDGRGQVYNSLRLVSQLLPKLRVYVISRVKMLNLDELFEKETGIDRRNSHSWLSTGWFTMAVALQLCDRINVYGMVPADFCRSPSHRSVPYHYYEPAGPDECSMYLSHERSRHGSHHRFITEKTVFANWARTLDIHFYQPDWHPAAVVVVGSSHNGSRSPAPPGS